VSENSRRTVTYRDVGIVTVDHSKDNRIGLPDPSESAPGSEPDRKRRNRRLLSYAGAGVVAALLISGAAAYFFRPAQTTPPRDLTIVAAPPPLPVEIDPAPPPPTPAKPEPAKLLTDVDCSGVQNTPADPPNQDQDYDARSNAFRITDEYLAFRLTNRALALAIVSEARCYGPLAVARVIEALRAEESPDDPTRREILKELGDDR
jgi:hypothetical protein